MLLLMKSLLINIIGEDEEETKLWWATNLKMYIVKPKYVMLDLCEYIVYVINKVS